MYLELDRTLDHWANIHKWYSFPNASISYNLWWVVSMFMLFKLSTVNKVMVSSLYSELARTSFPVESANSINIEITHHRAIGNGWFGNITCVSTMFGLHRFIRSFLFWFLNPLDHISVQFSGHLLAWLVCLVELICFCVFKSNALGFFRNLVSWFFM